ncbi:MAG: hypothetical protein LBQ33_06340 [Oscillospiraceae bacterium]|jgi:hypothetical protein|nr:hypothetical protein [Oscillospiraceae bacterium]
MQLQLLARGVCDVAATQQSLAYAKKDTKADGTVFASFFLCDWETLQCREIPEMAYLRVKFGELGARAADWFGETLTCRAARLPDGGLAVIGADFLLHLFRPDGAHASAIPLLYQDAPAYDLICDDDSLWCTVPQRNVLLQYSLAAREVRLRVGGSGVFPQPMGIFRQLDSAFVCCVGSKDVKSFDLARYEVTGFLPFSQAPKKFFRIFRRHFVWLESGLYAVLAYDKTPTET